MKYICFGYYYKDKFDGMTEDEHGVASSTYASSTTTIFAPTASGVGGEALQPAETV